MAKRVRGFMSEDNKFFETKAEAEYHDAKQVVGGLLLADWTNADLILNFMEANCAEVERFIKAIQAKRGIDKEREAEFNEWAERESDDEIASLSQPQDDTDQADDSGREEDNARPLKQPSQRGQYVSDLGRSVSPKEIRNQRKKHGSRSRKPNARRVRGGEDMATGASTEPPKAR